MTQRDTTNSRPINAMSPSEETLSGMAKEISAKTAVMAPREIIV